MRKTKAGKTEAKAKLIVQPKTVKQMLRILRTFLRQEYKPGAISGNPARQLWDILAALRGPDEAGKYKLKTATTAVIRDAVIGYSYNYGDLNADGPQHVQVRTAASADGSGHFLQHARSAFTALGLKWGVDNSVSASEKTK